jgi:hypothetical protein
MEDLGELRLHSIDHSSAGWEHTEGRERAKAIVLQDGLAKR